MTPAATQAPAQPWTLRVGLHLAEDGPQATSEPVTDADLADLRSELWLAGFLRKGHPDFPLDELRTELEPLFRGDSAPRCAGFVLQATNPAGETTRLEFGINAVAEVASRGARRLIASELLKRGDKYYYEIIAERRAPARSAAGFHPGIGEIVVISKAQPLGYLTVPLPPLLRQARTVGTLDDRWLPVLFTEPAF